VKRKRIAIYGVTDESLQILPHLTSNPELEIVGIYTPDTGKAQQMLRQLSTPIEASTVNLLTNDARLFDAGAKIDAIVDARITPPLGELTPDLVKRGVEIVSPMFARLLWGFRGQGADHKRELLQILEEVIESYDFTIDTDDLFERMLQIAIGATGADQGSLMLLDEASGELSIRMAIGIERELWSKIRVKLGEGIAGKVAAEASPFLLRGHADHMAFHIVHERSNIVSAISVPLQTNGTVIGVLNLHHSTLPDVFTHNDLHFVQQLAAVDAKLIQKTQEFERLRTASARYDVAQTVREILRTPAPMRKRLRRLTQFVSEQIHSSIAAIYLHDPERDSFTLVATSLAEQDIGSTLGLHAGVGIDGTAALRGEPILLRWTDESLVYAALPVVSAQIQVGLLTVQITPGIANSKLVEGILNEIVRAMGEEITQLEREEQIEEQLRRTRAVSELGIQLLNATTNRERIKIATSATASILGADHAIIRLRERETGRYCIRGYFGPSGEQIPPSLIHIDKIASRESIRSGKLHEVRNLNHDPRYCGIDEELYSLICAPLRHDGHTVGVFGIYHLRSDERLVPHNIARGESELFQQIVRYLERALEMSKPTEAGENAGPSSGDQGAGLCSPEILEQRIGEEIVRAAGRVNRVAVLNCAIENSATLRKAQGEQRLSLIVRKVGTILRAHLRAFDVLAQTGTFDFTALIPDLGENAEQQISSLARAATHEINQLREINEPVAIRLAFGYAVYPSDGRTRTALLERARIARIRVI